MKNETFYSIMSNLVGYREPQTWTRAEVQQERLDRIRLHQGLPVRISPPPLMGTKSIKVKSVKLSKSRRITILQEIDNLQKELDKRNNLIRNLTDQLNEEKSKNNKI